MHSHWTSPSEVFKLVISPKLYEVKIMEASLISVENVSVGHCSGCMARRVLLEYSGDKYCISCIETNEHLKTMLQL
jgi:hypothetical protein